MKRCEDLTMMFSVVKSEEVFNLFKMWFPLSWHKTKGKEGLYFCFGKCKEPDNIFLDNNTLSFYNHNNVYYIFNCSEDEIIKKYETYIKYTTFR